MGWPHGGPYPHFDTLVALTVIDMEVWLKSAPRRFWRWLNR